MQVFNAASKSIAVLSFAGNQITTPKDFVRIASGEVGAVNGPVLRAYGLHGSYQLLGNVLVRDWGKLKIHPSSEIHMDEIVLHPGTSNIYKRVFGLCDSELEGFFVSHYDDRHLIGINM